MNPQYRIVVTSALAAPPAAARCAQRDYATPYTIPTLAGSIGSGSADGELSIGSFPFS